MFPNKLWDSSAPPITPANPFFNFEDLLKASLLREQEVDPPEDLSSPDLDYLFSLSPLTSPCTSAPPTPPSHTAPLPSLDVPTTSTTPTPSTSSAATPTTPTVSTPIHQKSGRKARQQAESHRLRKRKRQEKRNEKFGTYERRENVERRYIDPAVPVRTNIDMEKASVTQAGFVGRNNGSGRKRTYKLEELCGETSKYRLKYVPWDGVTSTPITDKDQRIIAVLAGVPCDQGWDQLEQQGRDALENARSRVSIPKGDRKHRRGAFLALRCGVSHGSGQTHPDNLGNGVGNAQVLNELNRLETFRRLAGFASSIMASWAPELYKYYVNQLRLLYEKHPELKHIFPSSIFAAASYNFGPRTVCFKHTDFANLPFGWCAVTAFGAFDPKKGGHLILWDLGLVVEFPPGSTILLPSAVIAHSNVRISRDETRYSFAQYTAGGLFRWVENKFQLQADYHASLSDEELAAAMKRNEDRWSFGLSLFAKLKSDA